MGLQKNLIYCFSILLLVFATGCNRKSVPDQKVNIPAGYTRVTVIDYHELDGCTWMLQTENGEKFQPVNLDAKFQNPGTVLHIRYKHHEGMSICMAGQMIMITDIIPENK